MARQTLTVQLMHANARIASLEAELRAEREAHSVAKRALHAALKQSASAPAGKPLPGEFTGYYDYVNATRRYCVANRKPVSYLARGDWAQAVQA